MAAISDEQAVMCGGCEQFFPISDLIEFTGVLVCANCGKLIARDLAQDVELAEERVAKWIMLLAASGCTAAEAAAIGKGVGRRWVN